MEAVAKAVVTAVLEASQAVSAYLGRPEFALKVASRKGHGRAGLDEYLPLVVIGGHAAVHQPQAIT